MGLVRLRLHATQEKQKPPFPFTVLTDCQVVTSRVLVRMGELETEAEKTRSEIASYLRELAEQLDGDDAVTLELGGQQVQLDPTNPVTFKLEGESDWSEGDTEAKQSIEFELVWWREAQTAEEGALDITTEGQ